MIRFHRGNWPLAAKLTLAMTTMIVIVIAVVTLLFIRYEHQTFQAELRQQASLLLNVLETATGDLLYNLDADTLTDIIRKLARDREILTSGRVYDEEGRIIADAYDESLPYDTNIDPLGQQLLESDSTIFKWQSQQLIAGRAVIIGNQRLGAVSIGLPTDPLQAKLATVRNQGFVMALIAIIVGISMSLLISRSITKPLQTLASATRQIATGNLTGVIEEQLSNKFQGADVLSETSQTTGVPWKNNEIASLSHSFHMMAAYLWNMAIVADHISRGDITQTITPRSEQDLLGQAFHRMSEYLRETASVAKTISDGDLLVDIQPKSPQDVLNHSLRKMIFYIQGVANVAETISEGDLQIDVRPKSEQDVLNLSLQKMIEYLQEVAMVTERISNKDLQVEVTPKSEQDMLNISLQNMISTLQSMIAELEKSMAKVEQQNWLKTGQAELSDTIRGEQDTTTLAQNIITYLANYLHAQVGAIYLFKEERLCPVGGYAYPTTLQSWNTFKLGEGLVGQAAIEKQSILLTDVPDTYVAIISGFGKIVPRHILLTPFLYAGEVKGVLELGTIYQFTDQQKEFVELVAENIAIAFHSTEVREKLRAQREELRQTNEALEEQARTVEGQKRELEEKNLALENAGRAVEEKVKELELSNKYKSEFLANMSHELRTPLNSLLILSKLIADNKEENLTEKQIEFATTIHAAGKELLELINEILDLSKVESGKMSLNVENMHLKGLPAYIDQNFRHVAEEKHLELTILLADELPEFIRTDRQRVEQIVKNLLSNALKFTDQGRICVDIRRPVANVDPLPGHLRPAATIAIVVSDTGIGIPEDKHQLVFEAFQQVDGTASRKYSGTGLGLSITREFTKLLGGEIHLQSKEGKGSTFTLYLPEFLPEAQNLEQPVPPSSGVKRAIPPSVPEMPSGVETIRDDRHEIAPTDNVLLIVENDPAFAKFLFDLARERGFKVLIAGDGTAGVQLTDQYRPDAIMLDPDLPEIGGWRMIEKLEHYPDTRHIPIHFISAREMAAGTLGMGISGYLTKPVTLDKLQAAFTSIDDTVLQHIKKLLVVAHDQKMEANLPELLENRDMTVKIVHTGNEAYTLLKAESFDCIILDMGIRDISGIDLVGKIQSDDSIRCYCPIIAYSKNELSKDEELHLKKHAESIIIEREKSKERLLDEVVLFLHRVKGELPEEEQRHNIEMLHEEDKVLQGKTILMADDDMRNVFALSSVLEDKGMTVLIAENGREALEYFDNHSEIDLVLMDIMMPEMDGYETMQAIRKQPQLEKLPIIALTAKAMKGDRQKCIDAGANDYLSKPVDVDKLLSLLRVWLY